MILSLFFDGFNDDGKGRSDRQPGKERTNTFVSTDMIVEWVNKWVVRYDRHRCCYAAMSARILCFKQLSSTNV